MNADPLERVIRPIVEGQIRGFLHEHPAVVNAVDWYKKRTDKVTTFTNSLSKRITRDLISAHTRARIESALFEQWEAEGSDVERCTASAVTDVGTFSDIVTFSDRGTGPAAKPDRVASSTARSVPSRDLLPAIQWVAA